MNFHDTHSEVKYIHAERKFETKSSSDTYPYLHRRIIELAKQGIVCSRIVYCNMSSVLFMLD